MKLNPEQVARLFSSAIVLGIREDGYYRKNGLRLSGDPQKTQNFVKSEVGYARDKLSSAAMSWLRSKGAPSGTEITMDWVRFSIDPSYRAGKLVARGGHASKVAEMLRTLAAEIDAKYAAAKTQAKLVKAKLNRKGK